MMNSALRAKASLLIGKFIQSTPAIPQSITHTRRVFNVEIRPKGRLRCLHRTIVNLHSYEVNPARSSEEGAAFGAQGPH
jgi:hypothetical protein